MEVSNDVTIIGTGISGVILANLLIDAGVRVLIIGDNCISSDYQNGDVFIGEEALNVGVSFIQDVNGIVKYVLEKLDININQFVTLYDYVDAVYVEGEGLIYRPGSFERFELELKQRFPKEKEQIEDLLLVIKQIKAENWKSIINEKISPADIPLFMKYFRFSYKECLMKYNFTEGLQKFFLTYAPWEDVSMITMCGYWGQLMSVGKSGGFKDLHNSLFKRYLKKGGDYIFYLPLKQICNVGSNYSILLEDNRKINTKTVVSTRSREFFTQYGLGNFTSMNAEHKYPSTVLIVDLEEKLPLQHECAYLRFMFDIEGKTYRLNMSYLERNIIKIEILGDLRIDQFIYYQQIINKAFAAIGYKAKFNIIGLLSNKDIELVTGITDGIVNCWAHGVKEIMKNPLKSISLQKGLYSLGDWGNGYFYAAENYYRDILRQLNAIREVNL